MHVAEQPAPCAFYDFPNSKSEKNVPFTRQHIRRLQKAGTFPRPVPLGENTTAYLEEEIDEWLIARIAKRDVQQQRQALPAAAEPPVAGAGSARGRRKLSAALNK